MLFDLKSWRARWQIHAALAVASVAACGLAALYATAATTSEIITIGTGYSAIAMMAVTLVIGPLNLFRKRRNPVNIDLRREFGVWAGLNTLAHVLFGFQVFQAGQVLLYFLADDNAPRFDIFGLSNDVGLVALLVLLPILITSNQLSLRLLKGKRWKTVQRLTYPVMALSILHTVGYQIYNVRENAFTFATIGLCVAVIVAQTIGIITTRARARQRKAANASPVAVPIIPFAPMPDRVMARRRFLALAGGSLIGGVAVGTFGAIALRAQAPSPIVADAPTTAPDTAVADAPATTAAPTTTAPATDTPASVANATTAPGTATAPATTAPGATAAPNAPATNTPKPATKAPATAAPATSTPDTRTILATLTTLPKGQALAFTTPDTGESAFVIRRTDGSVTCFNGICTHERVDLVYQPAQQTLYCPRHDVPFNTTNGAPAYGPARRALAKYTVTVDAKGNIVYNQA